MAFIVLSSADGSDSALSTGWRDKKSAGILSV
jgi:hypothetical protein